MCSEEVSEFQRPWPAEGCISVADKMLTFVSSSYFGISASNLVQEHITRADTMVITGKQFDIYREYNKTLSRPC